jgi:hypothetical protein
MDAQTNVILLKGSGEFKGRAQMKMAQFKFIYGICM